MPNQLYLEVIAGADRGRVIALEPRRIPLGRQFAPGEKKSKWILFTDESVERIHGILDWDDEAEKFLFINKGHRNKSCVNGIFRERIHLSSGDEITLGDLTLKIRSSLSPEKKKRCESIPVVTEDSPRTEEIPPARLPVKQTFITSPAQIIEPAKVPERPLFTPRSKPPHDWEEGEDARQISRYDSEILSAMFDEEILRAPEFSLITIKGEQQGTKLPIYSSDLDNGTTLWISPKERNPKFLEVSENMQKESLFSLHWAKKSFSIIPWHETHIKVNGTSITQKVALKTGDSIDVGRTHLIFIEHQILEQLLKWEILVIKGTSPDEGKRFNITRETISIGRAKSSDILLSDIEVALHQATIHYENNAFSLVQRAHRNPTYLRGIPVKPGQRRSLAPDDVIRMSSKSSLLFRRKAIRGEMQDMMGE